MKDNTTTSQDAAPFALPEPDWEHWQVVKTAPLWCAVALACNLDPEHFRIGNVRLPQAIRPYPLPMANLLSMAGSNIGANGILRPVKPNATDFELSEISLANFTTWLKSIHYPLPTTFPWTSEEPDLTQLDWPWGRHSTNLLRKFAEAGVKFWKHYDPADRTTAPTNQDVVEWLKGRGVADRTAEVMATILRADGLPTGPRK